MDAPEINDNVSDYAPWRRGVPWWIVAVQGVILLAIGAFFLLYTDNSIQWVLSALAAYFVLSALWTIVKAMRGVESGLSVFGLLAAGGGLVAGLAVLLPALLPINLTTDYRTLLFAFAIAQVAMGVLMTASAFVEHPQGGVSWIGVFRGVVILLLGAYILYSLRSTTTVSDLALIRWIAIAALVVGALLCLYAFTLYRSRREIPAPVS